MSAYSLKEAVDRFVTGDFDLVLLDNSLPTKDRDRLTCLIRLSGSRIPVASVAPEQGRYDFFADATLESDPNKLLMGMRSVLLKTARVPDCVSMADAKSPRPRNLTDGPKAAPIMVPLAPTITCIHDLVADDACLTDEQMIVATARNHGIADRAKRRNDAPCKTSTTNL
jgi:CheY-like chemotaxis protein